MHIELNTMQSKLRFSCSPVECLMLICRNRNVINKKLTEKRKEKYSVSSQTQSVVHLHRRRQFLTVDQECSAACAAHWSTYIKKSDTVAPVCVTPFVMLSSKLMLHTSAGRPRGRSDQEARQLTRCVPDIPLAHVFLIN